MTLKFGAINSISPLKAVLDNDTQASPVEAILAPDPAALVASLAVGSRVALDVSRLEGTSQARVVLLGKASGASPGAATPPIVFGSGTSQQGSYAKFADGLLICWVDTSVNTVSLNNAYGPLWQGSWGWTFPLAFSWAPSVAVGRFQYDTGASWGVLISNTNTGCVLRGFDAYQRTNSTPYNTYLNAIAVGRWK